MIREEFGSDPFCENSIVTKIYTIALVTNDVIGTRMAGPGIRYWEFARILGRHFPVKLIVPPFVPMPVDLTPDPDFPAEIYICSESGQFRHLAESCDIIITLGVVLFFYPFLSELGKPLVLDLYNPFLLEDLQREAESDLLQRLVSHENYLDSLRTQLFAGDFFVCAGEKQRDYWLGVLSAIGRINPYTHGQDSTLRSLIDVVPFGLPNHLPQHTRPVLKGVHKTIAPEDKVILWGGGIWNWFDAPTLIKAMPLIIEQRQDVKLFFMGINRPNKNVARMKAVDQAINLSKTLGLFDRFIFFNDWVPYADRQNYLLEADVGVSLHLDHIETRFSFRTRLLDYLWTGLPIVSTEGDVMGETLAAQSLAFLVAPEDVAGVAQSILKVLDQPTRPQAPDIHIQQIAAHYSWEAVCQPLIKFCRAPYLASDKTYLQQRVEAAASVNAQRSLWAKGRRAWQVGGMSGLLKQSGQYLRWKINKYQKL